MLGEERRVARHGVRREARVERGGTLGIAPLHALVRRELALRRELDGGEHAHGVDAPARGRERRLGVEEIADQDHPRRARERARAEPLAEARVARALQSVELGGGAREVRARAEDAHAAARRERHFAAGEELRRAARERELRRELELW